MNRSDAKKIAEIITNEQLAEMFLRAKEGIKDWTVRSAVNSSFSKGSAWNILAATFDVGKRYHYLAKKNMVWEFGDFLDEDLKLPKKPKKQLPEIHHQSPIF